jgi:transcriptional regulator with XRE-family HTH domain
MTTRQFPFYAWLNGKNSVMNKPIKTDATAAKGGELPKNNGIRIGAKLRHARIVKGMKLSEVAEGVSVSESFISKLENDKVQPSLAVLHRMVAFLGVNVSSLFGDPTEGQGPLFVMRAGERPVIRTSLRHQTDGVNIEVIAPHSRKSLLQASIHEVAPGGSGHGLIAHTGEEIGFVLEGVLDLTVGKETCRISAGDSFFFSSEHPHGYVNPGSTVARIVWVNTPATF